MNVINEKYELILKIKLIVWYFVKFVNIFVMYKMICLCDW